MIRILLTCRGSVAGRRAALSAQWIARREEATILRATVQHPLIRLDQAHVAAAGRQGEE